MKITIKMLKEKIASCEKDKANSILWVKDSKRDCDRRVKHYEEMGELADKAKADYQEALEKLNG